MSPGLFQDFIDGYQNVKTPPIISWTMGSQLTNLPISGFPIIGFLVGGTLVRILWVANFRLLLY